MIDNKVFIGIDFPTGINGANFEETALRVFRYQYDNNEIYRSYTDALGYMPGNIKYLNEIPFLPISFFKSHKVVAGNVPDSALIFESSKTTGDTSSKHYVADAGLYESALLNGFEAFYGSPSDYTIIGLLPSYLERKNASLVYMARVLMDKSGQPDCGFYLDEWDKLYETIIRAEENHRPVLLIGVTFALLDFATAYPMQLKHTIVMETGGMKGRKEEWTREQVHSYLKSQWGLKEVHSEYGMTELLSQAYAKRDGIFEATNTMKVLVRDINDPLEVTTNGVGCLNIIDLANIHSCSFIATEDIGKVHADGRFEVLGRMDHAALRGCSLMAV